MVELIAFGLWAVTVAFYSSAIIATSSVNYRRIRRARAWLESRVPAEEVLIIGASLDAANELARRVAEEKGAAFGWHRLTLPQVAAVLAAPCLQSGNWRRLADSAPRRSSLGSCTA